jgi:hypothetical protein
MKRIKRFLLVAILPCLICTQVSAFKHFTTPKGGTGGGGSNNAPIDGGIVVLLVAGLAFGAKKIYDKNKKSKDEFTTI